MHETWVLVVEDDNINMANIVDTLEDEGIKYLTAEHGGIGWDILNNTKEEIKAIILDWMMPEVSGMELLKMLKRDSRFAKIPVIMQSARAQEKNVIKGIEEGVFQYLTKPFSEKVLVSMLKSAISAYDKGKEAHKEMESQVQNIREYAVTMMEHQKKQVALDLKSSQVINEFFLDSLECEDYQSITQLFLESIKKFSFSSAAGLDAQGKENYLRCSVLLNSEEKVDLTDRGITSNLDKQIIIKAMEEKVIIQKGSYTAISSPQGVLGVLIRNSPTDDLEKEKAVEILRFLLSPFEGRIQHFQNQLTLQRKNKQILGMINSSAKELQQINQTYQAMKGGQMQIIEGIEKTILQQNAHFNQEQIKTLQTIQEQIMTESMELYSKDQITDQQFLKTILDLQELLQEPGAASKRNHLIPKELGTKKQSEVDDLLASFNM